MPALPSSTAPVQATHSVLIHASPEKVWKVLADINQWPSIFKHVSAAKLEDTLRPVSSFKWRSGGMTIVSTVGDMVEAKQLTWTGKALGTKAVHSWTLSSSNDHVELITSEQFDGWLVRLMPGAMQKMLDQTLKSWLQDIKSAAEGFH